MTFECDTEPLTKYLNIKDTKDIADRADAAYLRILLDESISYEYKIKANFARKVLRDPYYGSAYLESLSTSQLIYAGFLDNNIGVDKPLQWDVKNMVTPLFKIRDNLSKDKTSKRKAIILSTGAFSPLHKGHLNIFEQSKQIIESKGYQVIGGYISPSSDRYVSNKGYGLILGAEHRIHICQNSVIDSDWLMVDPWESLHNSTALNFSDVLTYIHKYVIHYFPVLENNLDVFYLCGCDNVRFAYAFLNYGNVIILKRKEKNDEFSAIKEDLKKRKNIIFGDNAVLNISSTEIRFSQGNQFLQQLPDSASQIYDQWRSIPTRDYSDMTYVLRDEGPITTQIFEHCASKEDIEKSRLSFLYKFKEHLKSCFINSNFPDPKRTLKINVISLAEQIKIARKLIGQRKTISMDVYFQADYYFGLSRCHEVSAGKVKSELINRPGFSSLDEQLQAIPPGEYVLVEDDSYTGKTLKKALEMLEKKVKITEVIVLCDLIKTKNQISNDENSQTYDLGDLRDYIVGSSNGGLVVRLPNGEIARAPYIAPYVSLFERSSVPLSRNIDLSLSLWIENYVLFKNIGTGITLIDVDPHFKKLMEYIGFLPSARMEDVCLWHLTKFSALLNRSIFNDMSIRESYTSRPGVKI